MASIIHQDVDRTESLQRLLEQVLDARLSSTVTRNGHNLSAGAFDLLLHFLKRLSSTPADHDLSALTRETLRYGSTDPRPPPVTIRDFPVQPHAHTSVPPGDFVNASG